MEESKTKRIIDFPMKGHRCIIHKSLNLGYLEFHHFAENTKEKQIQCLRCGYWYFKREF